MPRLHPETEKERLMLAMGAIFVEENKVLEGVDELFESLFQSDEPLSEEHRAEVHDEIAETFFRLDMSLDPYLRPDCIGFLEEFWQVFDETSAQAAIVNLRQQGHRKKFDVLKKHTQSLHQFKEIFKFDFSDPEEVQLSDEDFEKLGEWIEKAHKYVPEVGILAWDAARYVHLVRMCFIANYLTGPQAWKELLEFHPLVENKFSTWNEFSQSFLIGRTFWAGQEDPELKAACERLLFHKASPWSFVRITNPS